MEVPAAEAQPIIPGKPGSQRQPTKHEIDIQKKVDRLKPLIAAMRAQTPDDPMKPADVIQTVNAANFATTIEEMNGVITAMNARSEETAIVSTRAAAMSMIGKKIDGVGTITELEKTLGGLRAQIPFVLPDDMKSVTVEIYDGDGQKIAEREAMNKAGKNMFFWDGKGDTGKVFPAGHYNYAVRAVDKNGKEQKVTALSTGVVTGVNFEGDTGDDILLRIGDASLPWKHVTAVGNHVRNEAAAAA